MSALSITTSGPTLEMRAHRGSSMVHTSEVMGGERVLQGLCDIRLQDDVAETGSCHSIGNCTYSLK